jgi:hypothetical protein
MQPQLEFLMRLAVDVGDVASMGQGPLGERRIVGILGGTFEGPQLRGEVLAGGADWQIVRKDGVLDLDARYALKEQRGGLVRVTSQGYRHGPAEVLAALARGDEVDPAQYFFRSVMRFETGAPGLEWLNKTIALASAERKARQVLLNAFRVL